MAENVFKSDPEDESPSDRFWNTYLRQASEEDKFLPNSWEANTGGVLTFTGLFAATVAAFLIESYKSLSPDTGDRTVALLEQLLYATTNASAHTFANIPTPEPFHVPPTAVAVNSLWFSSLLISLFCALLSTLIQEWARDYRRDIDRRRTLNETTQYRAFNHIYVRMGIDRYGMDRVVYSVTALVHLSVLLFVTGLVVFLFPIDSIVAGIATGVLGTFLAVYAVVSVLPLRDASCPYRTPATYMFAIVLWSFARVFRKAHDIVREHISIFHWHLLWREYAYNHLSCMNALQELTKRSITDYPYFLTSARFAFAWDHTRHHIMNGDEKLKILRMNNEPFEQVLRLLSSVIRDSDFNQAGQFLHLWSDEYFLECLGTYNVHSAYFLSIGPVSVNPSCFPVFSVLFRSLFVVDDGGSGSDRLHNLTGFTHMPDGDISKSSDRAIAVPAARLCVASIIHHYLQCRAFARLRGATVPIRWPSLNFSRGQELSLVTITFAAEGLVRHWTTDWVPLHAGDCCNLAGVSSAKAEQHAAASNALSAIVFLLEADSDTRDSVGVPAWLSMFNEITDTTELEEYLPSDQFVGVLLSAGFGEWLLPEGRYINDPNLESVHYNYLTGSGEPLVRALLKLARSVNWDEYGRLHPILNSLSQLIRHTTPHLSTLLMQDLRSDIWNTELPIALPCLGVVVDPNSENVAHVSVDPQGERAVNGEGSAYLFDMQLSEANETSNHESDTDLAVAEPAGTGAQEGEERDGDGHSDPGALDKATLVPAS